MDEQPPFSAHHPAFPGHFPGHPLVPGVLILDRVILAAAGRGFRVTGIASAKFTEPLLPETAFTIAFEPARQGLRFRVSAAATEIASGVLTGEAGDGA